MEINLTKIYKKYKGMWVALTESLDEVISYGNSAKKVHKEALKKGYKNPTLFKVPSKNIAYIG